ncbi:MAG: peptidoglycan-binding protein, partial [Actinobacteria bacterium]|nr:peptidoglycan-binding protein [Actinomycetota bacterium]
TSGGGVAAQAAERPQLRRGERGAAVRDLQARLNEVQDSGLAVDGIFGRRTRAAVRAFQRAHSLGVDGIVGARTWEALGAAQSAAAPAAGHAPVSSA